jgi:hypothetical protein
LPETPGGAAHKRRAAELVSLDLGPRSDIEIESALRREMEQERLTSLDRWMLCDRDGEWTVSVAQRDPFYQSLRVGRLQKLRILGLTEEVEPGRGRLAEGMDEALRRMGERGDIIRTMQRAITAQGLECAIADYVIADPAVMTPIVGRVIERGLSDEANDRHCMIVDGTDGRSRDILRYPGRRRSRLMSSRRTMFSAGCVPEFRPMQTSPKAGCLREERVSGNVSSRRIPIPINHCKPCQ